MPRYCGSRLCVNLGPGFGEQEVGQAAASRGLVATILGTEFASRPHPIKHVDSVWMTIGRMRFGTNAIVSPTTNRAFASATFGAPVACLDSCDRRASSAAGLLG